MEGAAARVDPSRYDRWFGLANFGDGCVSVTEAASLRQKPTRQAIVRRARIVRLGALNASRVGRSAARACWRSTLLLTVVDRMKWGEPIGGFSAFRA